MIPTLNQIEGIHTERLLPGSVRGGREEPKGMAGVHNESLVFPHLRKISHSEQVLSPVLEDRAVPSVGNKLMGKLCHPRVQIVLSKASEGRRK